MYGALRAALNVAVRRRLITFNPALTIELEELPRPRIVVWTAEQVGEFLDFVKDDRPEADRETLHEDPEPLGHHEVAELVHEDQHSERDGKSE